MYRCYLYWMHKSCGNPYEIHAERFKLIPKPENCR